MEKWRKRNFVGIGLDSHDPMWLHEENTYTALNPLIGSAV